MNVNPAPTTPVEEVLHGQIYCTGGEDLMHVRRHGDGWRVIVQYDGKRRSAVARTKAEASRKGAELIIALGGRQQPATVTVEALLAIWQNTRNHSATYTADVTRVIDRLPEHFTNRTLDNVDPAIIAHLYHTLTTTGWTPHRIRRIHEVLSSAWRLAIQYRWATTNPITASDPPPRPPHEISPPTADDVIRLLEAAQGTPLGLCIELAATTGARRGELVALQWADIDGTNITIRRSLAWTKQSGLVITDTKTHTKGHRVIALTAHSVELLRQHRLRQVELALASGLNTPVWILSHTAGKTPWLPNYPTHAFVALRQQLGITGVRLHDLRHFVATQLLHAGEPATTVAHRLGHSTTATTLKTYAHYLLATDTHAADTMDQILKRG